MKLIFLDIDGTLTTPGSNEPPQSALEAIRAAQGAGHKVFLCTGRNPDMLSPLLKYGFDGFIGCAGGYVEAGGEVLFDCPMTEEQRVTALRTLKEAGVFRTLEAKDGSFCDENLADLLKNAQGNSELLRWRKAIESDLGIRPMGQYDGRPIYKVVFMCERPEQLEPAKAALGEEFNFVVQDAFRFSGILNGEMINRKFHKGTAVRLVADRLGVPMAQTVGFGDSMNDREMIETVGTSVCMDNGSPALKAISDVIAPPVEEDGLARAFERLGLTGQ